MSNKDYFRIPKGILGATIGSSGPITITKNQVIRIRKKNSNFTQSIMTTTPKLKK